MNGLSLDGDSAFASVDDLPSTSTASDFEVDEALQEIGTMTQAKTRLTVRFLPDSPESFGDLVGRSPIMRDLFAQLERAARTDVSLLITGEVGTGKTLVARSVHAASDRHQGPFVAFDCGGVPSPLVHSELFGLQRGAFEGVNASRPGLIEQADGGTLFLNHVGELPKPVQGELLGVLKSRRVQRLGAKMSTPVDIRIFCATTRDLRAEVHRDHFREDLYLQVAAMRTSVPALRERIADLPQLIEHFLRRGKANLGVSDFPERVLKVFEAYHWPGNVRELESAVAQLAGSSKLEAPVLESSIETTAGHVALIDTAVVPLRVARRAAARQFEHRYLATVLSKAGGNVTRAAAMAEVSRQMIQRMLRKHGL
jgi:DNA-binding NtrC family response regulator